MSGDVTADVTAIRLLAADMTEIPAKLFPEVRVVTQVTCANTKRDGQAFAAVDTGFMRSSISYETHITRSSVWGEVGPTASYSEFVEGGTSVAPPQPFMGPAADRNTPPYLQALSQVKAVDL